MELNYGKNSNQGYNAGIYCRLSNEDRNSHYCESDSIINQKQQLTKYVNDNGWSLSKIYVDDGYSGLNFERPGFKEMIEDINNGIINMVITKDMSRLGRDYIDVGYYVEKYFPEKNIRYIALNDFIDSGKDWGNNDIAPFRAVLNDMYSKDISNKVRSVLLLKRREGKFIGAFAAYGYMKDEADRNRLAIDENTAGVVRDIFYRYLQGFTISGIAKYLNEAGIDSPALYNMKKYGTYKNSKVCHFRWSHGTIRAILTNPVYTGSVVQNKYKKLNYKSKKLVAINKEKWISVKDTHQAIISEEEFNCIQSIIMNSSKGRSGESKGIRVFKNLIFCGDCGSHMTYTKGSNGEKYAICSLYKYYGKSQCTRHSIRESILTKMILGDIREILLKGADNPKTKVNIKTLADALDGDNIEMYRAKLLISRMIRKIEILENGLVKIYYNFRRPC